MMSRYSGGNTYDYSPPTTPRGRRYILRNFNARKQRKTTYPARKKYDDYFDIEKAPVSQGSQTSRSSNHVGISNKVVPTENTTNTLPRKISPRKQPREPPVFVSPRKDPETYAKNQTPNKDNKDINGNITSKTSPRHGVTKETENKNSPRKDRKEPQNNKDEKDNMAVSRKTDTVLTPRDEYLVTRLYDSKIIYLKPSEVRYTHDQITAHFSDGRSMLSTFIAFLYGRVTIRLGGNDIPPIEVMQVEEKDGKLWYVVNGNRRLYIFRRLERCGALDSMQVIARRYDTVEMDKHFLTRNHGRTISIINDSQLDAKMKKEVQKWREKGGAKRLAQKPGRKKPGSNLPTNQSSCCTIL